MSTEPLLAPSQQAMGADCSAAASEGFDKENWGPGLQLHG